MGADISDVKQALTDSLGDLLDATLCELLDTLHETVTGDNDLTDADADQYAASVITWQEEDEDEGTPEGWAVDDGSDWDAAIAAAWCAGRDAVLEVVASAVESAKNT